MNCTEYYIEVYNNNYISGFFLLTTLCNTIFLFLLNNNMNKIRKDIIDNKTPILPTYSTS